jgi:cobalamin biosynthesis protein CobT
MVPRSTWSITMPKHARTLRQAMPIVASALGRKFGVQVAVGGDDARTDGRTIQVPALPPDSHLIPVAWGYLAHEAAHLRYTDFDTYAAGAAQGDPLHGSIQNIVEDVRIERALAGPYPGTRATLQAVCAHLAANGGMNAPPPDAHPARVLTSYLLLNLRHRVLGYDALAGEAKQAEAVLRSVFPSRTVHRLQGLLTEVDGLTDTAAVVDLARRIRALLEEERQAAEQPEPCSGPDESDSPGAGNSADSDDAPGQGDEHHPAGAGGDRDVDPQTGDDADDGEGKGSLAPGHQPNGKPLKTRDPSAPTPSASTDAASGVCTSETKALTKALSATDADLPDDLFGQVHDLLAAAGNGSSQCVLPRPESFDGNAQFGMQLLATVQQASRRLRARLHGLVQASRLDRPHARQSGPRLMPKRLYRAAVGDPRVFARERERIAVHTAIHLLIDLSGSMGAPVRLADGTVERRGQIAQASALALALALDGINGVSVAVTAFPGLSGDDDVVTRLVGHGERPRARAGAFKQHPRGTTPMAGALWFAAADLVARRESRRIALVLTDGKPDSHADTAEILRLCAASDLETVGVGIDVDVSTLFPTAIRVREVAELRTALFGAAERLLLAA